MQNARYGGRKEGKHHTKQHHTHNSGEEAQDRNSSGEVLVRLLLPSLAPPESTSDPQRKDDHVQRQGEDISNWNY